MQQNDRVKAEKAILVGLSADCFRPEENATDESLDELEALLETAGGICEAKVLQNRHTPDPHSFIGEGKAQEVRTLLESTGATLVVFDNDLSPSQIRALEELTDATVLDRSALILDIFAQRAKTAEGRLQVELAQYTCYRSSPAWARRCPAWAAASARAAPVRRSSKRTAATSASASPACRRSWTRCAACAPRSVSAA